MTLQAARERRPAPPNSMTEGNQTMDVQLHPESAAGPSCGQCGKPVGALRLAFGGRLACEPCIRRYYADRPEDELRAILAECAVQAAILRLGGARRQKAAR